jgi:hypothetical protein
MRKFFIAFFLLFVSSEVLMADLKPQYSSDVNLLKAEFGEKKVVKAKKKQVEKKKYAPSFMTNDKKTTKPKQKSLTISQPYEVKIIKVSSYPDITKYSLSHKKITAIRRTGTVTRKEIVKIAKSVKAKKVLIYVLKETRYIYFYKN